MEIFGFFNATDDGATLHTFLESWCENSTEAIIQHRPVCTMPPPDLKLIGLPSEAAKINNADGTVEILVVTQARELDHNFAPPAPSLNYVMSLQTDPSHLDTDLVIFREMLMHLKLGSGVR
jgi:hypothetical protein